MAGRPGRRTRILTGTRECMSFPLTLYHMNLNSLLTRAALVVAFAGPAVAADSIVPVAGTYVYTQNFNTLFAPAGTGNVAATPAWADNGTIPNWWFFYNTTNAANSGTLAGNAFAWFGADGSAAPSLTLNSMGASGNSDRALASPSTTNRGEQAGIVVFQNNGTLAVDLSRIQYNGEVRRNNGDANITESIFVWYQKGATQAAALAFTTAPATATVFPAAVATGPNSYYINNWTSIDAARWTYGGGAAGSTADLSFPIDAPGLTGIRVAPGQFIALRFGNLNDTGVDALMGIDDLRVTFTEVSASVAATVSNVVRQNAGTPFNPNDDTVDFTLTVAGIGSVGGGWTSAAPFANSGSYGVPKTFTGIPIAQFAAAPHAQSAVVTDATSGATDTFTVTAPWCTISAGYSNYTYATAGTELDASDDTVSYDVAATGTFTGPTYDLSGTAAFQTIAYGNSALLQALPGTVDTLTFTDTADPSCTTGFTLNHAAIIGTNSISGTPLKLLSLPVQGTRLWTLNSGTRQATQAGNPANANHEILSEPVNLTTTPAVLITGTLDAIAGGSSGFETADTFRFDLIIDGNTASPVSILGASDTNGNGTLEGNAAAGTELPGATVLNTTKTFTFSGAVPASANSVQLRIVGNSNSGSETYVVRDINIAIAPPTLLATASAATLNNRGTETAGDDTLDTFITITPINLGASTGWGSNLAAPDSPLSGLYSAPNPVLFSLVPAATRSVTLHDALAPTVTAAPLTITAPPTTITASVANIARVDNGPGLADDTVTFDLTVSGTNGGPRFNLTTDIGAASTAVNTLTSTPTVHSVTLTPAPDHGTVMVAVRDASYPATLAYVAVAVPAPAVPPVQIVLGQKNLGGGLTDVLSTGTLPAAWFNYPGFRQTVNTNGGATAATITSEVIDLSAVTGPVQFNATLRAVDRTAGFEAADTFVAQLILNGDTANPVNLITPYDANASGVMNGGAGAADDEFNLEHLQDGNFTYSITLSHLIPDSVTSVQLVITGANDSNNETFIVENVLFSPGAGDADGDGMDDAWESAYGLNPNSAADKFLDLDSDGQSNFAEFLAGTVPNNAASKLDVVAATMNGTTGAFSVQWTSIPGKTYRIQGSGDLTAPSWTTLGTVPASAGSTTTLTGTFPGPIPARLFIRVIVP